MRVFSVLILVSAVFLAGCLASSAFVEGQDTYSLALQSYAWTHSTISALVVTAANQSWWSPSYLNDSLRAIGQWNDALDNFAANYSDYSYLSNVKIQPVVSSEMQPYFDLYINWTESSLSNTTDEIGLATTFVAGDRTVTNCSINLAARTNYGNTLDDVDMQNIALHELGHALGLGHSNYTGDVMYAIYSIGGLPNGVSTLDVYGVATVFAWMPNPSIFYPVSSWYREKSVTLPSTITYQDLPVSAQNTPPQTLIDNPVVQFLALMLGVLSQPIIAIPVSIIIIVFVIVAFVPRRRKKVVKVDS